MKNMKHVEISGGGYTARIDPSRGANLISLRNDSYSAALLREPPADGVLDNPYLYGMPILFPVNRIENGRFTFEGREYVFPINEPNTGCHLHGALHETPFALSERSDNKAVFCYTATSERPYLSFPHSFEIRMEYALENDGLRHSVTVMNTSESNMPLFLGFHTTFNTLFLKESKPEDMRVYADITEEYERNMAVNYLPTGRKLPFDAVSAALSEGIFQPFGGPISRHYRGKGKMSVTDLANKCRLVYENDEKYTFRLIYNGGKAGYICLEPQNCLANCANSPFTREEAGFDCLAPGESKTYRSRIYLEAL